MHATLRFSTPVSDDEIVRLAADNEGWQIERDRDGALVVSPPTGSDGGARNAELTFQLATFAKQHGGKAFDSSAGFTMPGGAMYSPDGAWIASGRWRALTDDERAAFAPIVPDVWIELRSTSEAPARLIAKLQTIRAFAARYVCSIDPYERRAWQDA